MLENLLDVLNYLDKADDPTSVKLSTIINKEVGALQLTYAEKVLLIEGGKAGIADVTVPTFVEYELNSPITQKDLCIRSELVEWVLDTSVSKYLLKQNKLTIKGAIILSTADHNLEIWNENEFVYRSNRYSLDLSSQQIAVDIAFVNCNFIHGINISNSYTENVSFISCQIGISYDNEYPGKSISINAKNITCRGNITITARSNADLVNNGPDIIQGHLIFDSCETNELSVKGHNGRDGIISGGLIANYLNVGSLVLQNMTFKRPVEIDDSIIAQNVDVMACIIRGSFSAFRLHAEFLTISGNTKIHGKLNLQQARVQNTIMLNQSTLMEGLEGYDLQCGTLAMAEDFNSYGVVTLTFAKIAKLWCDGGQFSGYPTSIVAGGIASESMLLRNGFVALFGIIFNKCNVVGDIQLLGSFVGPSQEKNRLGVSLDIKGGTLKNLQLADGFTSLGMLDLQKLFVNGSLTMNRGRFLNEFCLAEQPNSPELRYAIYANSINIKQKLSFNVEQASLQDTTSDTPVNINKVALLYLHNLIGNEMFRGNGKLSELIRLLRKNKKQSVLYTELEASLQNWYRKIIPEAIKDELPFEPVLEAFINDILDKFDSKLKKIKGGDEFEQHFNRYKSDLKDIRKVLHQWIFNGNAVHKISKDRYLSAFANSLVDYAVVFGEAYFEEMILEGQIDCAGALFYRKNAHVALTNALTVSHSKVNGTMYLNRGYVHRPLPMLVNGEVDLQYSYIQQLNISPELAFDLDSSDINSNWKRILHKTKIKKHIKNEHTRWRLIGTKYDYITDDALSLNESTLEHCDWIYADKKKGNFKQPFEQFAESLFRNGSDISARETLIYKTPSKHFAERIFVMFPIRAIAFIAYPAYKALIGLLLLFLIGSGVFNYAAKHNAIVPVSPFAYVPKAPTEIRKTDGRRIAGVKDKNRKKPATISKDSAKAVKADTVPKPIQIDDAQKIQFQPIWYSAQCLIPLINTDQKDMFKVKSNATLIYFYFIVHTAFGALLIAIFLLGISRIRRNS